MWALISGIYPRPPSSLLGRGGRRGGGYGRYIRTTLEIFSVVII